MDPQRELLDAVRPAPADDAASLKGSERLAGAIGFWVFMLLNQILSIRISYFKYPERIGEFAMEVGLALARRRSLNGRNLFCVQQGYPVSNEFFYTLVARNFRIRNWLWPILRYSNTRSVIPSWILPPHGPKGARDNEGLLENSGITMRFTPEEDEAGVAWLKSVGWRDGEPFVCLLVRDATYLDAELGNNEMPKFGRHDYRDSDIETYMPAAEWLAEQGVWVLRMGKRMANAIRSNSSRIVDYAFLEERSDFLDVWLFANCSLCISTGTGPDAISGIYRRPLLFINFLPALSLWSWSNAITAPKPLAWRDSGQRLNLPELIALTSCRTEQCVEQGVVLRDLDAGAILEIVQEAWGRLKTDWADSAEDCRRNRVAWAALEAHPDYEKFHGYRHPNARISSTWLEQLEADLARESWASAN